MESHEPHDTGDPQGAAHEPGGAADPPGTSPTAPEQGGAGEGSTGLAPNVAGALAYLVGPITGIVFLVLEKRNGFVRFHAAQSIGLFVTFFVAGIALSLVSTILAMIPIVGWIVGILVLLLSLGLSFLGLFLWLYLMYKAYSGAEWEFPWVGHQSRKLLLGGDSG